MGIGSYLFSTLHQPLIHSTVPLGGSVVQKDMDVLCLGDESKNWKRTEITGTRLIWRETFMYPSTTLFQGWLTNSRSQAGPEAAFWWVTY